MLNKIKNAKANTLVRVNNVIYAKATDAENSRWRSAFGEMYANAFINLVLQSNNVEFLDKEPLKPNKYEKKEVVKPVENIVKEEKSAEKRNFIAEKYNVREEEHNEHTD